MIYPNICTYTPQIKCIGNKLLIRDNPGPIFISTKFTIMTKKDVHVVPHHGDWGVKVEGNSKMSKVFGTQSEASDYGRERAINNSAELLIHGKNGQIREKNSYGNDPYPPKG